jgi:hypothetical protein
MCGTLPIKGIRYKCFVCSDFNLCEFCFTKADEHKMQHAFLYISRPEVDPSYYKNSSIKDKASEIFKNENPLPNAIQVVMD